MSDTQTDPAWQILALDTGASITSFGQDEAGELYLTDRNGNIYRLTDS